MMLVFVALNGVERNGNGASGHRGQATGSRRFSLSYIMCFYYSYFYYYYVGLDPLLTPEPVEMARVQDCAVEIFPFLHRFSSLMSPFAF